MATKDKADRDAGIRRYGPKVIVAHWLFIITLFPLLYTGLLLLRDWFTHEFHIYGVDPIFPTFEGTEMYHWYFGVALLLVGLVHVIMHIGQKEKPILPKNVGEDLAANIHNIMYIFHMSPREERGAAEKYKRNQRMTYVAFGYVLTLTAITVLIMYLDLLGEVGEVLHIIAGILIIFLAGYRMVHLIRTHDWVAWKCILATGRMPEWYVRKNHFLWYRKERGGYKAPPDPEYEKFQIQSSNDTEVVKG
jgi:cytochrome b subunit of formate dehydrogenase